MTSREYAMAYWNSGRMKKSQHDSAAFYFPGRDSNSLTGSEIEIIWKNEVVNKPKTVEDVAKEHYGYDYGEDTAITDKRRDAFVEGADWRQANTNDLFTATDMGEFALWCAKNYGYHKGYYVHKADREKKKLSINIYDLLEEFKIKRYENKSRNSKAS